MGSSIDGRETTPFYVSEKWTLFDACLARSLAHTHFTMPMFYVDVNSSFVLIPIPIPI